MFPRAQRIHRHGSLVLVVLAPVDKHFPGALFPSSSPTRPSLRMIMLEQPRQCIRVNGLGDIVGGGGIQGHIDLQAFRSGSLRKTTPVPMVLKNLAKPQPPPGSTAQCSPEAPGRDRTPT